MPISVFLFGRGNAAQTICLKGELDASEFSLDTLQLPGGQELPLDTPITGLPSLIEQITGDDFQFAVNLPDAVSLTASFSVSSGDTLFGREFDTTALIETRITVVLPPMSNPQLSIEICGRLEIGSGVFVSEEFCFEVQIPDAMPGTGLPELHLGLPDFGLNMPSIPFPWSFPVFPLPPYSWPALSFDLSPLPIRVGYRSLKAEFVDVDSDTNLELVLDIQGLTIEGLIETLEADVKLVLRDGVPDLALSTVKFIRPDLAPFNLPEWHFEDGCLILKGTGPHLNQILHVVMPELEALRLANDSDWVIRFLWDEEGVSEVRIDIVPDSAQGLHLPGFRLDLPASMPLHLVFRREDAGDEFVLAATIANTQSITAALDFSWLRGNDRELLKDDSKPNPPISLKATRASAPDLSIVIMQVPIGRGRPVFLRKAVPQLEVIDPSSAMPCEPTLFDLEDLELGDFTFTFDLSALDDFKFPFLREDGGTFPQNISIKRDGPPDVSELPEKISQRFTVTIAVGKASDASDPDLKFEGSFELSFFIKSLAFKLEHDEGIAIDLTSSFDGNIFGFKWELEHTAGPDFRLITKDSNYQLRQLPGSRFVLKYERATTDGTAIEFDVENFLISPKGISLDGTVRNSPAKLNAVNQIFRFEEGKFQLRDNRITGFSIAGSGPLPPELVGAAEASINLTFAQRESGELFLESGGAELRGEQLLRCDATRFNFNITAIGLQFVDDKGRYHFYFTLSGSAKLVLADGDDPEGPLAWMPTIELQLVECPLTSDVSVLARHIEFHIVLPKKETFSFLGCFDFELRAIGFYPQATVFGGEPTAAMRLSGQVLFDQGGGDAIDVRVDFHDMWIGLPAPGRIFPRLHLNGLGVKVKVGSAFDLEGEVNFLGEDTDLGGGVLGEGFAGRGALQIQGLPRMVAGFAFLRVRRATGGGFVRAWFVYFELNRFSLKIPVIEIYWREGGIGFGYRFTLAMIQSADELSDPRQLLKRLKEQARSQGELSKFEQWRVDLEEPGESPRWTIALRAMFSQTSAAASFTDWNEDKERALPCLFLVDAVAALRSDLTFLMVGRGWLWTNYHDFTYDKPAGLREKPLVAGFLLLSPRRKRFLANLSSNPDAVFGENSVVFPLVEKAVKSSKFSATLLIEPGLIHYELGWPNQLQWKGDLGPLQVEFRGGMIVRVSRTEFVMGQSFLARGRLAFSAGVDFGFVGARLSATADVAYGARYIGVLSFEDVTGKSAFYGGAGIEINVSVSVEFWIEIDLLFGSITIDFSFSFSVNFTASVEVGILLDQAPGLRGHATLGLRIMGHNIQFGIKIGINEDAVKVAYDRTQKFLHVGLEADEVEAIPGTSTSRNQRLATRAVSGGTRRISAAGNGGITPSATPMAAAARVAAGQVRSIDVTKAEFAAADAAANAAAANYSAPSYSVMSREIGGHVYFLLLPAGIDPATGLNERGFIPVPPALDDTPIPADLVDFEVNWAAGHTLVEQFAVDTGQMITASTTYEWQADWHHEFEGGFNKLPKNASAATRAPSAERFHLRHWMRMAFICDVPPLDRPPTLNDIMPRRDPNPLPSDESMLEDERVHNPSDDSFEAAVRGAVEQFESAPYFKRSPSEYDVTLMQAFDESRTLYTADGTTPARTANVEVATPDALREEEASHMRGVVIRRLVDDYRKIVKIVENAHRPGRTQTEIDEEINSRTAEIVDTSLAMKLGLLFRCEGDANWLINGDETKIKQRLEPADTAPRDNPKSVTAFHTDQETFDRKPPRLQRVVQYAHEGSVAIDWDLVWPDLIANSREMDETEGRYLARRRDPTDHLSHYHIRRRRLDGDARDREFQVKAPDVLHKIVDQDGNARLKRLRHRFQFVDNFADESDEDRISLPPQGRRYAYTITPIDATGHSSGLPHTVVVRRRPATPPPVVTESEFVVDYAIPTANSDDGSAGLDYFDPNDTPKYRKVEGISLLWKPPVDESDGPAVAVDGYRILFRRQRTLPIGQYAQDGEIGGDLANGFPVSHSRPLRSDLSFEFDASDENIQPVLQPGEEQRRPERLYFIRLSSIPRFQSEVPEFVPEEDADWLPEGWDIFVQTRSVNGVYSTLTPASVRLRFSSLSNDGESNSVVPPPQRQAQEERRPGMLEWLPGPVAKSFMPPRDTHGVNGYSQVPMPVIESGQALGPDAFSFRLPPDRRRSTQFRWNQGFSVTSHGLQPPEYPTELHSGFELYEFDVDAHLSDEIDQPGGASEDFARWIDEAKLRRAQEFELADANALLTTPSDTSDTLRWEAWYPSTIRRMELHAERARNSLEEEDPDQFLSPWFSWKDSYLNWPEASFSPPIEVTFVPTTMPTPGTFIDGKLEVFVPAIVGGIRIPARLRWTGASWTLSDLDAIRAIPGLPSDPNFDPNLSQAIEDLIGALPEGGVGLPVQSMFAEVQHAGQPRDQRTRERHPLLDWLIESIASEVDPAGDAYRIVFGIVPDRPPGTFTDLIDETGRDSDAYGWRLLQRTGLSTNFILRHPQSGEVADRGAMIAALNRVLARARSIIENPELTNVDLQASLRQLLRHIHVETLFQQSRATRLAKRATDPDQSSDTPNDLLAVLQLSLRPTTEPFGIYLGGKFLVKDGSDSSATVSGEIIVTNNSLFTCDMILRTDEDQEQFEVPHQATGDDRFRQKFDFRVGTTPTVLFRCPELAPQVTAQIEWDPTDTPVDIPLDPVTHPSALDLNPLSDETDYFAFKSDDLTGKIQKPPTWFNNHKDSWIRLKTYVEGIDPRLAESQLRFPTFDQLNSEDWEGPAAVEILIWLSRYFDYGGMHDTENERTGTGWWLATAYYRGAGPIPLTPDPETGVLEYFHPIDDKYAHSWRYYIRPVGRYDRLWQSVGGSHELFADANDNPNIDLIVGNLTRLRTFKTPPPAGLDLGVPRIRRIDPPAILFSGRLDVPPKDPDQPTPEPPGKAWQVVIAKHPEQILSEHNRTVARRLAYRQISVSLVRRFQFPDWVAWLRGYSTKRYQLADRFDPSAAEMIQLVVDGIAHNIDLSAAAGNENTVHGAATAINAQEIDGLTANAVSVDGPFVLRLTWTGAGEVQLLLEPGNAATDTLINGPVIEGVRLVDNLADRPELPLAPVPQAPLDPYDLETEHEVQELMLPDRLGRFGQGALVYQWNSIPYFYQHQLLAVAQSTDVVSGLTRVVQTDFEYVAPLPKGSMDASGNSGGRFRRIQFRLENYWSCLPETSQQHWHIENPDEAWPNPMPTQDHPYSALPDPDVLYQLVIARPGGVIQTISQIYFSPGNPTHYEVRNFPGRVGEAEWETSIERLEPWGTNPARPWEMYLHTKLAPKGVAFVDNWMSNRAITSIHNITPPTNPRISFPPPVTAELALVSTLTAEEFDRLTTFLLTDRDISLRLAAENFLERVENLHTEQRLFPTTDSGGAPVTLPPQPGSGTSLERRFRREDDGSKVRAFLYTWSVSEAEFTAMSAWLDDGTLHDLFKNWVRPILADFAELHAPFVHLFDGSAVLPPPPVSGDVLFGRMELVGTQVTITGWALPENQRQALIALTADGALDADFRSWLSELLVSFDRRQPDTRETVSLGLDQLKEIVDDPDDVTLDEGMQTLTWDGVLTDDQRQILEGDAADPDRPGWINVSPFKNTIQSLLDALPATIVLQFDQADTAPPTPVSGDPLHGRIVIDQTVDPSTVTWTGRNLSPAEQTALEAWRDDASFGPTFTTAISDLLTELSPSTITLPILEQDWQPRPTALQFAAAGLEQKVLLARAPIRFEGLMLETERTQLELTCGEPVDRLVIRRLYGDALQGGFAGASLEIQTVRGSAEPKRSGIATKIPSP